MTIRSQITQYMSTSLKTNILLFVFLSLFHFGMTEIQDPKLSVMTELSNAISDAKCSVESVQYANSKQLHSILLELLDTTYFRLFKVNLKRECPFWLKLDKKAIILENSGSDQKPLTNPGVVGSPLPTLGSGLDVSTKMGLGPGGAKDESEEMCSAILFGKTSCSLELEPEKEKTELESEKEKTKVESEKEKTELESEKERAVEEAEQWMAIDGTPLGSKMKWTPPTDAIDKRISLQEGEALTRAKDRDDPCVDEDENSPTFWLNICSDIDTENNSQYINLLLNPEHWTGYNGSQVWQAIYEENCFVRSGSEKNMCYEERVLYRLLSGMHTSINIHTCLYGKRSEYMPNPQRFVHHFQEHPERLLNLHFAFVVLLRSLYKAAPYLEDYPFISGNDLDDLRTKVLVKRLLDSHVLQKCDEVFSAFDESLLFKINIVNNSNTQTWYRGLMMDGRLVSLKKQIKGVFHNISRLLDCVSCQTCKLHAKLHLLGIGTALKILLTPEPQLAKVVNSLKREEVVALLNTIGRWSHSITSMQDLANLYQASLSSMEPLTIKPKSDTTVPAEDMEEKKISTSSSQAGEDVDLGDVFLVDKAVGAIALVADSGKITTQQEALLIDLALSRNTNVMILSKHYYNNPLKFVQHVLRSTEIPSSTTVTNTVKPTEKILDAIIVGGGLAGLTSALTLLDRGATVAILEKESFFGGNSAWASSGINAVDREKSTEEGDSIEVYVQDMIKASGYNSSSDHLLRVLTEKSGEALSWLRNRVGMKLDQVGQLGGHSFARTHRPTSGIAGADLIYNLGKMIEKGNWGSQLKIIKKARVTKLLQNSEGHVIGVEYVPQSDQSGKEISQKLMAHHVILATGGYANDHSETSLLKQFVPEVMNLPTTNGRWTTGDGHKLAMSIGADAIEMKNVQIHPTGFIDPAKPDHVVKTLCAEILRGVGGLLLDSSGHRFCDELGTRDYVVQRMLLTTQGTPSSTPVPSTTPSNLSFIILLNDRAADEAQTHIAMYLRKGLIQKVEDLASLADLLAVPKSVLQDTIDTYNQASVAGIDSFGKKYFHNVPWDTHGSFYVGHVTPVVHYCMGGLHIDASARVLRKDGTPVIGLYAAGEVIGGLHGKARLGGNALTECVVFGRTIGEMLPLKGTMGEGKVEVGTPVVGGGGLPNSREVTMEELARHSTKDDCWVAIEGTVYNFTDFLEDHPGGDDAILRVGGNDGTEEFKAVHTLTYLEDFQDLVIGKQVVGR